MLFNRIYLFLIILKLMDKRKIHIKKDEKVVPVFLNEIIVDTFVNEICCEKKINFFIHNITNETYEISSYIPLDKYSILKSFKASIGDKVVISKVMEKEKAQEKYSDSIAEGNYSVIGNYDKNDTLSFTLGNIQPNDKLILEIFTSSLLQTEDKSFKFKISSYSLPQIKLSNKINSVKVNKTKVTYNTIISCQSEINRLISKEINNLNFVISEDKKTCNFTLDNNILTSQEATILFRTSGITYPTIYEENDKERNIYSYSLSFMFDEYKNIPKTKELDTNNKFNYCDTYDKELINDYPASFIFVIDQSGSMKGQSMEIAKESLKLFIKSLPQNSQFDIIGFGDSYLSYFSFPLSYTENNVITSTKVIDNIKANLGGTNISGPMKHIHKRMNYYDQNLMKRIIILTDGKVTDSAQCYKCAESYSPDFSVHTIGIGNNVDKEFIRKLGETGKGSSHFAPNLSELKSIVVSALNSALQPYITNLNIKLPQSITPLYQSKLVNIIKQDSILLYTFLSKTQLNTSDEILISYNNTSNDSTENLVIKVSDSLDYIGRGDSLAKTIIGYTLKQDETSLSPDDCLKLSLQYNLLSSQTSFYSKIENENQIIGVVKKHEIKLQPKSENNNKNYKNKSKNLNSLSKGASIIGSLIQAAPLATRSKQESKTNSILQKKSLNLVECDDEQREDMLNLFECNEGMSSNFNEKLYEKSEVKYNQKKNSDTKGSLYKEIITSQRIDGSWKNNSIDISALLQKENQLYIDISTDIKNNLTINDKIISIEDAIFTMLILIILKKEFSNLYSEHKLIMNKTEKLLKKANILIKDY